MDDALVHIKYDLSGGESYVLILVVMDDALVLLKKVTKADMWSLNPCCNG